MSESCESKFSLVVQMQDGLDKTCKKDYLINLNSPNNFNK